MSPLPRHGCATCGEPATVVALDPEGRPAVYYCDAHGRRWLAEARPQDAEPPARQRDPVPGILALVRGIVGEALTPEEARDAQELLGGLARQGRDAVAKRLGRALSGSVPNQRRKP